jgi:hypothetical protein
MKIVSDKFFAFIFFLFGIASVLADPVGPPPPMQSPDGWVPPGDEAPIDDGVYVLLVVAILFGLYIIYSNKRKTETSV